MTAQTFRPNVSRFTTLGAAIRFSATGTKMQMVLHGDNDLFWVCFPREASRLQKLGYEIVDVTPQEILDARVS
jgi:hypothetical protein